jgi:single-strand DNA-binding protein
MNAFKNKVSLMGRLGGQPELVKFDSGRLLARFSLATHENFKDKFGEWHDFTQWHTINAWGKIAEKAGEKLEKGMEVVVEGKLVNQQYENKAGEKRFATIIELYDFIVVQPKKNMIHEQPANESAA